MSVPEDRFGEAVHDVLRHRGPVQPSADLFTRVVESIDADRHRRRRLRAGVLLWLTALALATVAVLIAIALWLGPFIKRFGRAYAADVFHDNPLTGKSYIVLTDVVYYLIFTAYIFFTVHFAPPDDWRSFVGDVTASQLQWEVVRVGGILLIIGILHGVNIVLMPVLGRLFSLNRRLPAASVARRPQFDDSAERSIYRRAAELERAADDDDLT
jgi:hypothetical protein